MKVPTGNLRGLTCSGIVGPWKCEECGQISQYGDIGRWTNIIFCRNEACRYQRIVDKRRHQIRENDGSYWHFDNDGNKTRIRGR